MNLLILLFSISLTFAAQNKPGCGELAAMVEGYEKALMNQSAKAPEGKTCVALTSGEVKTELDAQKKEGEEGYPAPLTEEGKKAFNDLKCAKLSVIDSTLERLRNEESLLSGFDKLKATIATSQEGTKETELAKAQESGKLFLKSLRTAQSLELLLKSQSKNSNGLMADLRAVKPEDRKDVASFMKVVAGLCPKDDRVKSPTQKTGSVDACNPALFKPDQGTVDAINVLVDSLEEKGDKQAEKIKSWYDALAIRRKNSADEDASYSFNEMQTDLSGVIAKLEKNEALSRDDLRAISRLDQFENASGLVFVEDLMASKKQLSSPADRFKFLVEDLANRQAQELQSKISLAWSEVKKLDHGFSEEQMATCHRAFTFESSMKCLELLKIVAKPNLSAGDRAAFDQLIGSIDSSRTYHETLVKAQADCLAFPARISQCFTGINRDKALVRDQINSLNLLKEKITREAGKGELSVARDFAMEKMATQCKGLAASTVEGCDSDFDGKISREATVLAHDTMEITLLFSPKPESVARMEELCKKDSEKDSNRKKLCAYFEEDGNYYPDPKAELLSNQVADPNSKFDLAGAIAKIAAPIFAPACQPPMNPYPTMPNVFLPPTPPLHRQILDPHVFIGGMGSYRPASTHFP